MRMPILCDMGEVERLHGIAYRAALQTGAKGEELDHVTSAIFRPLLAKANRDAAPISTEQRPALQVIQGGADILALSAPAEPSAADE